MNHRITQIKASEDYGSSGTKVIDIDAKDIISRLTIVHRPVGGSDTPVAHPVANISKIELVDGSDVLFSCSGYQAQALNIIEDVTPHVIETDARNGGVPMVYVRLDFGRFLWDPLLALDPTKFSNLQLKITWDEAAYDASCTSHSFSIFAHVFDEKAVTPPGFLMTKEQYSFEPSSDAYEYVNLPVDYPIRKVMVRAHKIGAGVRGICKEIRISEDHQKRVFINGDIHELRGVLDIMSGESTEDIVGNVGSTSVYYFCVANNLSAYSAVGDHISQNIGVGAVSGGRMWVIAETGTTGFHVFITGRNPHGMIAFPFGVQNDIDDWYDVSKLGSLEIRLRGGPNSVSGDNVQVVTQQLRNY